ncbi:MAG: tetratricopeptide repeat protein [Elusimicrobia bacterium]|nr:tetratricopeptide repeat protein [Elusimicrobiota bacterium]
MKKILLSTILFAFPLSAHAYDKIDFKGQIISPAFNRISAVAAMGAKIIVADAKSNAVLIFDSEGKLLKRSSAPLRKPAALAVGNSRIYVADTGNSRVVVLDAEGALLWAFSGGGSLPGQLSGPRGLAYGPDDRVYVSNTGRSRIEVFNSDGIFLYNFEALKADGASKLKPGKIVLDNAGYVYVSDPGKSLIVKYDRTGKVIKEYNLPNDSLAVDDYGVLYVITAREGKVREVAATGEVLGIFGTKGKSRTAFAKLVDIDIKGKGVMCLADEGNKKVTLISIESKKPAPLAEAQPLGRFNLKGPVKKYSYKSDIFTVKPDLSIIADLPQAREVALLDGAGKKTTLIRYGNKQGQVKNPKGFAIGPKGRLYISDTGNNRVQIFNAEGAYANMFGEGGSNEGNFKKPAGITVNAKGRIYTADSRNKRVQAFNDDGIFLFAVGPQVGNVALQNPVDVCVDNDSNLYILDSKLKKVIVTDGSGKFLRIWDDSGNLKEPVTLAYDSKTYFYILDRGDFNVKIFDAQGKFISSFFAKGLGERELKGPQYLAIADNKLYIADYEGAKILAFELSYKPEAPLMDPATSAGAAMVKLAWYPIKTPWVKNYAVFRAASETGEFKKLGSVDKPQYSDASLTPDTTYYYSVAGVSVTDDIGAKSAPLAVYFEGPKSKRAASAKASVGVSASVGVGEESGPGSTNVAPMEILPVELNYIFSANYKYYMKNPIGRIAVRNNTDSAFSNVKLSVFLKDFMDFPSDSIVAEIKPQSRENVDIKATLNNKILTINEDTPIQCQLTLTYYQDGAERTVTLNKPIKVLSKNAIIWDKASRLANFITAGDTPIKALKAAMLGDKTKFMDKADFLNDKVVEALMIWEGLGELGINYQADPVNPFSLKKSTGEAELTLDTVQFPRNTIKLKSGDCDDLTALYASLFKADGLDAAILDYPGHIALMFNTGAADARNVGIPEEYLIKYKETWWVGVEGTMTGQNFYDSVKHQADLYKRSAGEVKIVEVDAALQEFEPVTLPDSEFEPSLDKAAFNKRVTGAIEAMRKTRYDYFKKYYGQIPLNNPDDIDANTNLGILEAQYDNDSSAEDYFGKVLKKEPVNAAALNNMGNLSLKRKKYDEAKDYYHKAAKADPYDANIWLNLARVSVKLGKNDDVQVYAKKAAKLDPSVKSIGDMLLK